MRKGLTLLFVAVAAAALPAGSGMAPAVAEDRVTAPDCMEVSSHVRYGAMGYDHIVRLHNGCDDRMQCEVSTNANPHVMRVQVDAGDERELVTYRGSPARAFDARVTCVVAD